MNYKLNRRTARLLLVVAVTSTLLAACQSRILTPTELESVKTANDAYIAYENGDCPTVRRLADEDALGVWMFNEMRHSMLLVQGFCRELDGDVDGARDIYRRLIAEAPNSFAADDATDRIRLLRMVDEDPEFASWASNARNRFKQNKVNRTPIDRVPAEFPPLAKATGISGYAVVEFGVTQRGETENPIVVESSPPLLFDGASVRAIRRWQYLREPNSDGDNRQLIRLLFQPNGRQISVE